MSPPPEQRQREKQQQVQHRRGRGLGRRLGVGTRWKPQAVDNLVSALSSLVSEENINVF